MNKYRVWVEVATEDTAQDIEADAPADAACDWARATDEEADEFCLIAGGDSVVVVVEDTDGTRRRFEVSGELEPSYTAELVV